MPTLELTLQRKTDSGYPVIASLTRPSVFLPLRREGTLIFRFGRKEWQWNSQT